MDEYDDKFPLGLSREEKDALEWKIDSDYRQSDMAAFAFKEEYLAFAVTFYTRNACSIEDVVVQHQAHLKAERRKFLAETFMTDIKSRLRARELAHN